MLWLIVNKGLTRQNDLIHFVNIRHLGYELKTKLRSEGGTIGAVMKDEKFVKIFHLEKRHEVSQKSIFDYIMSSGKVNGGCSCSNPHN